MEDREVHGGRCARRNARELRWRPGHRVRHLPQWDRTGSPSNLIAGDTNTRVAEEAPLAEAALVGTRPPHATWDSKRNGFRSDAPRFTAHFTRWFASPGVTVSRVTVDREPVESEGHRFHLSDHFPLSGTVRTSPG